jgi:hypothetical protein
MHAFPLKVVFFVKKKRLIVQILNLKKKNITFEKKSLLFFLSMPAVAIFMGKHMDWNED